MNRFPAADAVLEALEEATGAVSSFEFPALAEETVTDDGETFAALRCPWCETLIADGVSVSAVDYGERRTISNWFGEDHFQHRQMPFAFDGRADFAETSHYIAGCCDKPVSLPDGWTEVTP